MYSESQNTMRAINVTFVSFDTIYCHLIFTHITWGWFIEAGKTRRLPQGLWVWGGGGGGGEEKSANHNTRPPSREIIEILLFI